ncbi:hypothetical protein AVEN_135484-1 [Araneus ventricosus]|uniref:Uncharacterized protein n=1 Tax=Araneus ventricosus TaxID=182803 RepID=A0A4Y2BFI3_ARAVE|nr:hypothetical protein AVEN_135484-1 [Araneus ventricosus]
MPSLKPVIHDRSTSLKWRGGTPHRSIFQPIYLDWSFTAAPRKPISYGRSRSPTAPTSSPACSDFLYSERASPFPHVSTLVAFQYLWLGSPYGALEYLKRDIHQCSTPLFFERRIANAFVNVKSR